MRCLLLVLMLWAPAVLAGPIYEYRFEMTGTTGPLTGVTNSIGSFTYEAPDDPPIEVLPTGARIYRSLRFLDFAFVWNNVGYSESTVLWGEVALRENGMLMLGEGSGSFGSHCGAGRCTLPNDTNSFIVTFVSMDIVALGFPEFSMRYATDDGGVGGTGSGGTAEGEIRLLREVPTVVPEPSTLALLSIALLSLSSGARWRRSAQTTRTLSSI